jgi:hypothetical protein
MGKQIGQRDWILSTTKNMIHQIDSNITLVEALIPDNRKVLVVGNIPENLMSQITLLTNTDENNNYLYLEGVAMFISYTEDPLYIPALSDILIDISRQADTDAFLKNQLVYKPFSEEIIGSSFTEFITKLLNIIPNRYKINELNRPRKYTIVLNPDLSSLPTNYQNYTAVTNTTEVNTNGAVPNYQTYQLPSNPVNELTTSNPGYSTNYSGIYPPTPSLDNLLSGNCPYVAYPTYPPYTPQDLKDKINTRINEVNTNIRQLNNTVYYVKSGKFLGDLSRGELQTINPAFPNLLPIEILDQINGINSDIVAVNGVVKYVTSDQLFNDLLGGNIPQIQDFPFYPDGIDVNIVNRIKQAIITANIYIRQWNNSVDTIKGIVRDAGIIKERLDTNTSSIDVGKMPGALAQQYKVETVTVTKAVQKAAVKALSSIKNLFKKKR